MNLETTSRNTVSYSELTSILVGYNINPEFFFRTFVDYVQYKYNPYRHLYMGDDLYISSNIALLTTDRRLLELSSEEELLAVLYGHTHGVRFIELALNMLIPQDIDVYPIRDIILARKTELYDTNFNSSGIITLESKGDLRAIRYELAKTRGVNRYG